MKIELKNRGLLLVFDENRYVKITGELTAGPNYIFYADLISLNYWTYGIKKEYIKEEEKEIIIQKVQLEGRKIGLEILFD